VRSLIPVLAFVVAVEGCSGQIIAPGGGAGADGEVTPVAPGLVIPARVRRLTQTEFNTTVDVLLKAAAPTIAFPNDSLVNGYLNKADALRVSPELARNLWADAPGVASVAATELSAAATCTKTGTAAQTCARQVLTSFASRAYRRPAAAIEIDELMVVFKVGFDGGTFDEGLRLALQVVFQSPDFLYHTELGAPDAPGPEVVLTADEQAEQLAYLLTGAPPDAQLQMAASSGALTSASGREEQARRLLATPQARTAVGAFGTQWLDVSQLPELDRDATKFPNWAALEQPIARETQDFFASAVLEDRASFAQLFTSQWTVASGALATFYGATAATGTRVTLPANQRSGVLTQAAVLASQAQAVDSSPIRRGHFVRTRLLCQKISAPPTNLNISIPAADPARTTRERFAAHTDNAACSGCHLQMDPIGYGLEAYDAIGHFRTTDNQRPVDNAGKLNGTDVDGAFTGANELADKLSKSKLARACFAEHWLEFFTARSVDVSARLALASAADDFLSKEETPVTNLIVDLVRSDLFSNRARVP
jgi:hypothetical protein